jgi:uncharacterized spore protein YtfJ
MPEMQEILSAPKDILNVKRVFGEPIEKGDVTVVPVASLAGGAGGGRGQDAEGADSGEGGGYGGMARPAGVYVIRGENVSWQPALDVTRLGVMGIALAALITMVIGSAIRRHQIRE